MDYEAYLRSREWRQHPVRLAELKAAGFRCRLCNGGGDATVIELHHRTYDNLGNEQPGDLTALCRDCHSAVTDRSRRARYAKRQPMVADVRAPLENPSPLFDPTFKEYF